MYKFDPKEHAHFYGSQPLIGTSTACKIIGKPLTWWAAGLAVEVLGWKNGKTHGPIERLAHAKEYLEKIQKMSTEEYVNLLDEGYKAHSVRLKDAASDGTDLHADLEGYVKSCIQQNTIFISELPHLKEFSEWAKNHLERFLFSEIHCYSTKLWTGGICDAGAVLKNGDWVLIDFKSAKDAYYDHFIQIALYDLQLSESGGFTEKGEKIFTPDKPFSAYVVVPFGKKHFEPKFRFDTADFKHYAEACLTLYKGSLNYEK